MKIMIFTDLENLRQSLWKIDQRLEPKYDNLHFALADFVVKKFNWEKHNPRIIRSYIYTGEYTENLLRTIKKMGENSTDEERKSSLQQDYGKSESRMNAQGKLFEWLIGTPFVELKTTPLKYDFNKGVYQKGIDVLIAVDLLSHSHNDNFDVAILCSGDLDLLESIKLAKNLGKKIIIVSHPKLVSKNIIKVADFFLDITKLKESELNQISNIMYKKFN